VRERRILARNLEELYARQAGKCALTGRPLNVDEMELDHKIPLADGGDNEIDNVQWLEASVNRAKGTMSNAAFIEMCKAVARWSERENAGETCEGTSESEQNANDFEDG
jgi:5-methylcytosine-specific restriction endonuclease McrA